MLLTLHFGTISHIIVSIYLLIRLKEISKRSLMYLWTTAICKAILKTIYFSQTRQTTSQIMLGLSNLIVQVGLKSETNFLSNTQKKQLSMSHGNKNFQQSKTSRELLFDSSHSTIQNQGSPMASFSPTYHKILVWMSKRQVISQG